MLQAHELRKSYGSREVVAGVSFSAAPGEILGLLGPNGAGKTTIVSMLCGLVAPESGSIAIAGEAIRGDTSNIKRRIGLVPQDLALYEDLSARRNLELFGALYGVSGTNLHERCNEALDLVGLRDRAKDKPRTFSGGMQRRLNMACALVHDPDLLLLDEPTVGVDPQSRNAIFDNLQTLKARGKTLVYTTHYMEEAERLCDRVVIIDHGKVVANDTLQGLYRLLPAVESLEIEAEGSIDVTALAREPGVKSVEQTNGKLFIGIDDLSLTAPIVLAWLAARGHTVRRFASGRATLESVFLALTGRQLRD
jgi:ABC-2 type transport system ATP-binding protein